MSPTRDYRLPYLLGWSARTIHHPITSHSPPNHTHICDDHRSNFTFPSRFLPSVTLTTPHHQHVYKIPRSETIHKARHSNGSSYPTSCLRIILDNPRYRVSLGRVVGHYKGHHSCIIRWRGDLRAGCEIDEIKSVACHERSLPIFSAALQIARTAHLPYTVYPAVET